MHTGISSYRLLGPVVAVGVLLQACGGPKSSSTSGANEGPVPTSTITMALTVESKDPQTAVVRANLNDGKVFGESYRLDGGDYLRACINGVCKNMADNDSVTTPDYVARFDYQPGVDYVVSFNRNGAAPAPDSHVALPGAFTLVAPANHQQVTDGETVIVEWAPTGVPALASIGYTADCTLLGGAHSYLFGVLGPDSNADGRESVRIDPIVEAARSNTTSPITRCSIDVIVSHELQGQIDPALHKGTARGVVSRQVTLDYVPR